MKPSVLIGSSTEGLAAAKAFKAGLQTQAEVTIWDQGTIFAPERGHAGFTAQMHGALRFRRLRLHGRRSCGKQRQRGGRPA